MGEFFDPTPPRPHHCQLPDAGSAAVTGSLRGWRCECGKAYERYTESQHGESWQAWRRAPKFDTKKIPDHLAARTER